MMFFDCMYYLIANLYKRFKSEADSWHGTSVMLTALFSSFFVLAILLLFLGINDNIKNIDYWMGIVPTVFFLFLFIIRYNKMTNYDNIKEKIKELDRKTYIILKSLVILFMLFGFFGFFGFALYFGPTFNKSL